MSLNHIVLVGSVDRPPEKRVSPEGVGTTTFKLKVLRPARVSEQDGDNGAAEGGQDRPERFDFIPVLALRRLADAAADLRAGETVAVEGRLETFQLLGEQYRNGVRVVADAVHRVGAGPLAVPVASAPSEASLEPEPALAGAGYADEPDLDDSIPF